MVDITNDRCSARDDSVIRELGRAAARRGDGLLARLLAWQERVRQRRALQTLSDRMLHDIGISRSDVDHEVSKPFWRP